MSLQTRFQTAVNSIYPPRCVGCGALVASNFGLCSTCWAKTPFIGGTVCDACGTPLPGEATPDEVATCDDCLRHPRPWAQGRSALIYEGQARQLVLGLKHGDRQDIFRPATSWLLAAAEDILTDQEAIVVPVPLHWMRLLKRRYNQSALLAQSFARLAKLEFGPDVLVRPRGTSSLDGKTMHEREETVAGAIEVHPRRKHRIVARRVILMDDVMTTGATLAAATRACQEAGAGHVSVLTLARVVKEL